MSSNPSTLDVMDPLFTFFVGEIGLMFEKRLKINKYNSSHSSRLWPSAADQQKEDRNDGPF